MREEHLAVDDDGLVFNEDAIGVAIVGFKGMNLNAVRFEGGDVGLVLGSCNLNVGWSATEVVGEGFGERFGYLTDQGLSFLVHPNGGHVLFGPPMPLNTSPFFGRRFPLSGKKQGWMPFTAVFNRGCWLACPWPVDAEAPFS